MEELAKNKLPYHVAFKKATYMDEKGNIISPTEPNAYKFEAFIFDAFSSIPEMLVMRVKREEEFAPVKNAEGVDSPETARKLYKDYLLKYSSYLNTFSNYEDNVNYDYFQNKDSIEGFTKIKTFGEVKVYKNNAK